MFSVLMIPGNGIIPRYHQSGFIREENISEKTDKTPREVRSWHGVQIITAEMFDRLWEDREEMINITADKGSWQPSILI